MINNLYLCAMRTLKLTINLLLQNIAERGSQCTFHFGVRIPKREFTHPQLSRLITSSLKQKWIAKKLNDINPYILLMKSRAVRQPHNGQVILNNLS